MEAVPCVRIKTMNRKLRVAILGGGGILQAHAPGFTRLADKVQVVCAAESDPLRHDRMRKLLDDPNLKIYMDYNEVFQRDDIDAVDIILPHFLHMDAAVKAANKGWHVLTEKVMARNTWECQRMIDVAKKNNVVLMVSHDRRYAGDWVALNKIVKSGKLGRILFWKLEHNQDVVFPEGSWVRDPNGLGGGAIMSCLTHQIDALRWMGGEVEKVNCMTVVEPSRMMGECAGTITAKMASGALAQLSINWYTQSHDWAGKAKNRLWYEFIQVCGTEGEAYYMHGKGTFMKLNSHAANTNEYAIDGDSGEAADDDIVRNFVKVDEPTTITGHQKCIEEFVKASCGEPAEVLTSGEDTIKTVEVAEAAYIAASQDVTVKLPIPQVPWEDRVYYR